jgi:hypothetical protein
VRIECERCGRAGPSGARRKQIGPRKQATGLKKQKLSRNLRYARHGEQDPLVFGISQELNVMSRTWLALAAIAGALAAPGVASASTYVWDVTTISGMVVDLHITTGVADSVLTPGYDITKVTGTVGGVSVSNFTGTWGPNSDQVSHGLYLDPYLNQNPAHIDGNGANVFTVQNPPGSGGANFEIDNVFYAGPGNSNLSYQGGIGLLLANGASYYLSANTLGSTASGPGLGDGQYYDWLGGKSAIASAPEASTWAMMGLGFAGLGFAALRRRPHGCLTA